MFPLIVLTQRKHKWDDNVALCLQLFVVCRFLQCAAADGNGERSCKISFWLKATPSFMT